MAGAELHESTDGELVEAALLGRRAAFTVLASRYRRGLYATALSRLGEPSAEDAVQETLLAAWRSLSTYQSQYSFRTWLWTILLNQCRRALSKRRRWLSVFAWGEPAGRMADDPVASDADSDPEFRVQRLEQSERLAALLRSLPEHQADALRLRFFGQLKFIEIAQVLGCSLSTAKHRVRLGLMRLSQTLVGANCESLVDWEVR